MSFIIKDDEGRDVWVKTHGFSPDIVHFGESALLLGEFLSAVLYVLLNTDLRDGDPRRDFVRQVQELHKGAGYNHGGTRFIITA